MILLYLFICAITFTIILYFIGILAHKKPILIIAIISTIVLIISYISFFMYAMIKNDMEYKSRLENSNHIIIES